jgi:hypothetical protein
MRLYGIIFCFGVSVLLVACDTAPIVSRDIPWNSKIIDQKCVRQAIENTPGIKFEREETRESTGTCYIGECGMKFFTTYYTVTSNKKYQLASVEFKQTNKGRLKVESFAGGTIFEGFPKEDRLGFENAQRELGKSIAKSCPESSPAAREQ